MNANKPFRSLLSSTAFVAALGVAAASAQAQSASSPLASGAMRPMASAAPMSGQGTEAMHQTMMSGMAKMQQMKPTGDTDKDFAMMMKMHH